MRFQDRFTGIIYTVNNPALYAQYEADTDRFEKLDEVKVEEPKKSNRRKRA
jgi:hypothetical protein